MLHMQGPGPGGPGGVPTLVSRKEACRYPFSFLSKIDHFSALVHFMVAGEHRISVYSK